MKDKNTGWIRILKLIIPYLFIVGFFQFLAMLIIGVDFKNFENYIETSENHFILLLFNLLGTFFVLWLFMKYVDKEKFINLGFHFKSRLKEFNYGIIIGALIMIVGYLLLLFMDEIEFKEIVFNLKEVIISILIYAIVAIVEEMLFRGYILRNLMISYNKYIALIISSILFSAVHGFNPNIDLIGFVDLFFAGILLGISYIFTKNLWFPIALHFSWNLTQTFLGFNVSGNDAYSIIEFKTTENNLLNGGDFGFEGSIFSIIAQIVFIVVIWVYYHEKLKKITT
jgi:membrane protease YdiL (CAAX protease family)